MSLRSDLRALKYFAQDISVILPALIPFQAIQVFFDRDFQARMDQAAYAHDCEMGLMEREEAEEVWEPHERDGDCCTFHQPAYFDTEGEAGGELPDYPGPRVEDGGPYHAVSPNGYYGFEEPDLAPKQLVCALTRCSRVLSEVACVSDIVDGMFCSDRCRKVAEIRSQLSSEASENPSDARPVGVDPRLSALAGHSTDSHVASAPNPRSAVTSESPAAGSSPRPAAGSPDDEPLRGWERELIDPDYCEMYKAGTVHDVLIDHGRIAVAVPGGGIKWGCRCDRSRPMTSAQYVDHVIYRLKATQ